MIRNYDSLVANRRDDVLLAERLLAREERALREVIDTYGGAVYGIARRVISESNMAEEVAQDTFLALWRRPGAYDPARGTLKSFLLGVARNKAIDLVRKEETQRKTKESLKSEIESAPAPLPSGSDADQLGDSDLMKGALRQLSELQREALVLAYYGGRTYREVAQELDIPEGTAKTRLRDGLIRLKEVLGGSGITS